MNYVIDLNLQIQSKLNRIDQNLLKKFKLSNLALNTNIKTSNIGTACVETINVEIF